MTKLFDKMFCNVLLLGLAFMLIFTAFQTCGMIQSLVISSMNIQYPDYDGNGYISLSIIYAVFAICNWIAPSIVSYIGPKYAMLIGGITYCLFIMNFLFHLTWALYLGSVLIGFGAAVIWNGQGNFLTINSDSETMARNSGVFWAMMQCSFLFGSIFFYFELQGKRSIDETTRLIVFGVLLGICCAGLIVLVVLIVLHGGGKTTSGTLDLSGKGVEAFGPKNALMKAFHLMQTKEMIMLSITFFYTGLELCFFSGVYGTCIGSTLMLADDAAKYVGISGIFIGAGEIIGGAAFGILGKKTNAHGRDPIILLGYIIHIITFFLIFINMPANSPIEKTWAPAYIKSNLYLAIFCSFGLGFGDACFNTQLYSILGFMYPDDSAPAFAVFKFFQSVAAAIAFYYSTVLLLHYQLLILVLFGTIGTVAFWFVEWKSYEASKEGIKGPP